MNIFDNLFQELPDNSQFLAKEVGKFGLNQNARVASFIWKDSDKEGNSIPGTVEVTVTVNDSKYINWLGEPNRLYFGKDSMTLDELKSLSSSNSFDKEFQAELQKLSKDDPFQKAFNSYVETLKSTLACIRNYAMAVGVKRGQIIEAIKGKNDFASYSKAIINLLPKNYSTTPVDVFLQFQNKTSKSYDRTFLELPKNLKHGEFICPAVKGKFSEVKTKDELFYIEDSNNSRHPFERGKRFLDMPLSYSTNSLGFAIENVDEDKNPQIPAKSTTEDDFFDA